VLDLVQTVVAVFALLAAGAAGVVSWRAYRASYRPMLRVIPLSDGDVSWGPHLLPDRLLLKNIGRGPAISIVIVKGRGSSNEALIGEVESLEPLGETYGPEFVESSRVGRVKVFLTENLVEDGRYRVLYVDVAGSWHETDFKVLENARFESRIGQPRFTEEIPRWVRERSQIVEGSEL
jgi:hypothetical protein